MTIDRDTYSAEHVAGWCLVVILATLAGAILGQLAGWLVMH